jgi:hypothetical protein
MRVDFADQFVRPNFAADIERLHGTIRGLSSDPNARARVSLEGRIGHDAPVTFSGSMQPFAWDKFTDLTFHCENVSLPVFNPYSGRFAGYDIDEGELTTDIHYLVRNRQLSANHSIRIDELHWGERSGTKPGAPLPVRLATSLLRDRNGVIALDLPLQGTLDDPKFDVWSMVWDVLGNMVAKAATAPFTLLASVFKGSEKAQFVEFAPGSAELAEDTHSSLQSLSRALTERPNLKVEIPIGFAPELDRSGLWERKYQEAVTRTIARTQPPPHQGASMPSYEDLDPEAKLEVLAALYKELTGKRPRLAEAPPAPKDATRKGAKAWQKAYELETLEAETRGKIIVQPSDLDDLGRRRAEAIERALTSGASLDSNRVLLRKEGKVGSEHGKVRLELRLK